MTEAERAAREAGVDVNWVLMHEHECNCCGVTFGPVHLDRCSVTGFPRGLVCATCAEILKTTDDRVGLGRVIVYLVRTQPLDPRRLIRPLQLSES